MLRDEVGNYLNKVYEVAKHHRLCDSSDCDVSCGWDIGDAEVPEDLEDFDAFTFWVDGGSDYCDSEFNVIITDDKIYNGDAEEITFQDVKDYVSDMKVVETKSISHYL